MKKWRLKSKEERRFKQGHPWVYSNELQESPKGIEPGELVSLYDASGDFLAVGFGNPNSLIAFRGIRQLPGAMNEIHDPDFGQIFNTLIATSFNFRARWFSQEVSCRVIFGEVDGLPGLVVDRYVEGATSGARSNGQQKVIYVIQPHSAGMDKHLELVIAGVSKAHKEFYGAGEAFAILRRDAGSREREGIEKLPTVVISLADGKEVSDLTFLSPFRFAIPGIAQNKINLNADLIKGQKTGFFFDQLENIRLTGNLLKRKLTLTDSNEIKILDLCSYVGQWGVQIADLLLGDSNKNLTVSVTVVDASETALSLAEKNLKEAFPEEIANARLKIKTVKADVLDPMPMLGGEQYDLVIADPPALIKSRKVIPQGKQAYVQLMGEAIRRAKPKGLVVACSCSQLLSTEDFIEVLGKSARRTKNVRWLAQGSASLDHFLRFEFREGNYLKCFIGEVE